MKILFLTHNLAGVGGNYLRAFSLAREVARRDHAVTLLAGRAVPGLRVRETRLHDVRVVEMPDVLPRRIRHGGLSPVDIAARAFWAPAGRFDVIHAFGHRPAVFLPAWLGHKSRGGLLVLDWADLWGREGIAAQPASLPRRVLGQLDHFFERRVQRAVDGVTVISSDLDRRAAEIGIPRERRLLLPPGADVDSIRMADKAAARHQLGLPLDAHIAAHSGYAPYDEVFLQQAILELLRRDPMAWVVTCGLELPDLKAAVTSQGLGPRLVQYGALPLPEVGTVLAAADLLVLPYLNSSVNRGRFPNKFGDYLAAGRPIITHRTGDLGEAVAREQVGVLASEDPSEFANEMLGLFQSPLVLDRLGLRAREFAEKEWNWQLRAGQLLDFYQRLRGALLLDGRHTPSVLVQSAIRRFRSTR